MQDQEDPPVAVEAEEEGGADAVHTISADNGPGRV